jgi:hypothetical protein
MIVKNINKIKRSRTSFVSVLISMSLILAVLLTANPVSSSVTDEGFTLTLNVSGEGSINTDII